MSREIKFRAWDKKTKKMREVDSIAFHNRRGVFDFDDSRLPKVVNLWGRDCIEDKDVILHREKNQYVLMQFTGIHDKDGKDIYEGDVVQDENGATAVYWSDVMGAWAVQDSDDCAFLLADCNETMEVIGNIYEDKGLLG